MTYRNILVQVGTDPRSEQRMRVACALAKDFGASVSGLFVGPRLMLATHFGSPAVVLGSEILDIQRRAMEEASALARRLFDAVCGAMGTTGEFYQEEGEPGTALATYTRYFDLCVLTQSEVEGASALVRQVPERVVVTGGRPVLIIPYAGSFERVGRRVLVAWNSSREAARAVHDALPLLARAEHVTVFEVDPEEPWGASGAALVRRLARHDVEAEVDHTVSDGIPVGEILLSTLADRDADLLVMGAYGHSRMRELVLGGVTRSILGHMTVPVLMSY